MIPVDLPRRESHIHVKALLLASANQKLQRERTARVSVDASLQLHHRALLEWFRCVARKCEVLQQTCLIDGKREGKDGTMIELRHSFDVMHELRLCVRKIRRIWEIIEIILFSRSVITMRFSLPAKTWRASPMSGKCNHRSGCCWCWCESDRVQLACKRRTFHLAQKRILCFDSWELNLLIYRVSDITSSW